jgi:hypothetical protein
MFSVVSETWNSWNTLLWVFIGFGTIGSSLWGVVRLVGKHVVKSASEQSGIGELKEQLENISAQYRNNGGSSMRDAIDRIEESQRHIRADVLRIDKGLERHLGAHEGLQ